MLEPTHRLKHGGITGTAGPVRPAHYTPPLPCRAGIPGGTPALLAALAAALGPVAAGVRPGLTCGGLFPTASRPALPPMGERRPERAEGF